MTSETYLDLTFERATKSTTSSGGVAASSGPSSTAAASGGGGGGGGVVGPATAIPSGPGKRPIRPKLLKLSDVTIPHRNRKKTKTKVSSRTTLHNI